MKMQKHPGHITFLCPGLLPFLSLLLAFITNLEGTICLVMAIPIYLPLASLGGVIGGAFFYSI